MYFTTHAVYAKYYMLNARISGSTLFEDHMERNLFIEKFTTRKTEKKGYFSNEIRARLVDDS